MSVHLPDSPAPGAGSPAIRARWGRHNLNVSTMFPSGPAATGNPWPSVPGPGGPG